MDCHFRDLPLIFHWWVGTVNLLGLCSDEPLNEHLFLIIITPRSSNLVENFLFYE